MKKILLLLSCLWLCLMGTSQTTARYAEEDPLLLILQKEMNEQFLIYSQKTVPVLRMWFDVTELEEQILKVSFGALENDNISCQHRTLTVRMVVGNEDVNNYSYRSSTANKAIILPLSDDPKAIPYCIQQLIKETYLAELENYRFAESAAIISTKTSVNLQNAPSIVDTFRYEPRSNNAYNKEDLILKMAACTQDYVQDQDISACTMWLDYVIKRIYRIDNAGNLIVYNDNNAHFRTSLFDLNQKRQCLFYNEANPDDLPPIDILRKDAAEAYFNLLNDNPKSPSSFHRIRPYNADMDTVEADSPDALFNALQDEIDANLEALRINDNYPPYYISYLVSDLEKVKTQSSLGNIQDYSESKSRQVVPTVKIGMDLLNDEHFREHKNTAYSIPLNDNYNALKSALWAATHVEYDKSVTNYIDKQNYIQDHHIDINKLPADHSTEHTTNVIQHKHYESLNISNIQNHLNEISSIFISNEHFKHHIQKSAVTFETLRGNVYFLASDGVQYAHPTSYVKISIYAESEAPDGYSYTNTQDFVFADVDEELVWDSLSAAAYRLGNTLLERIQTPDIKEVYDGPVLFVNEAVSQIFTLACIQSSPTLINKRSALHYDSHYHPDHENSLGSFINKQIISNILDIYTKDHLDSYEGHALIGSYTIDAEGVPVDKKTQLVHRGELISLLTNRESTANYSSSNGHQRFLFSDYPMGVFTGPGAGTLVLSSHHKTSLQKLEKQLCKQALEDGYSYAYIIEHLNVKEDNTLSCIAYRIDARTGKKKMVRYANIQDPTLWQFRSALATSNKETYWNALATYPFSRQGKFKMPVSVITPTAILFKNWQISTY